MLYLSKLSAYLRPSSLLDFFKTNDTNFLTMHIQDFFNSPTTPLLKYLSYLSSDSNIFYTSSSFNLTSQNLIGSIDNIISSNLSTQFLGSMSAQITDARKYTVAEELRVLLPKYKDIIETFEVLSVNVDNSLYAHLSLPPVKLYYPEPFVASPSFVHEDVWFIHILHFQH